MRPRRPSAGPVAAGGGLVVDPHEGEPAIVGRVRQDLRPSALETEVAELALRQRRRGQGHERGTRDQRSAPATFSCDRPGHSERPPIEHSSPTRRRLVLFALRTRHARVRLTTIIAPSDAQWTRQDGETA